jgi:hypothetical protein
MLPVGGDAKRFGGYVGSMVFLEPIQRWSLSECLMLCRMHANFFSGVTIPMALPVYPRADAGTSPPGAAVRCILVGQSRRAAAATSISGPPSCVQSANWTEVEQ